MNVITDPKQAGERLLQFARESRLVQNTWHAEVDGREVACHLGAAAGIDNADKCPASLMPKWMALVLPGLSDGQTDAHAITFAIRWGEAMLRPEWTRIDWNTVRGEWLAFVVQQAQDAADAARAASASASAAARAAAAASAYARAAAGAAHHAAETAACAASYAAYHAASYAAYHAAAAYAYADAAVRAARDAQGDALMAAIERAMGVARG